MNVSLSHSLEVLRDVVTFNNDEVLGKLLTAEQMTALRIVCRHVSRDHVALIREAQDG